MLCIYSNIFIDIVHFFRFTLKALDNRHIYFQRQDNLLTERFWNGIEWVWSIHRVPQTSDGYSIKAAHSRDKGSPAMGDAEHVPFCSPVIGTRDSCAPLFDT